jgi:ABC-type dipeptide/oligopeptide/nickel transport system permease subunit
MGEGKNRKKIKTPTYYVRKRLQKNIPAMCGLVMIVVAHLIAFLGYIIMPDQTPNANDGSALIKKQPPGFSAKLLKVRKSRTVEKVNFVEKMYMGQESDFTIIPVGDCYVKNMRIFYARYGRPNYYDSIPLIPSVLPLYQGISYKLITPAEVNYKIEGEKITYLDPSEELHTISKNELEDMFMHKSLENRTFLLGTDKSGRDILSRLLFGTRISLSIGFISVLISVIVGVSLGALAGFFGGVVDNLIQWLMTVVWSIPGIMLVIAISLALQSKGIWVAFVAVGLTMWVDVARVVRGEILSIKEKLYVEAARALGIRNGRIIFVHILPNLMGPLIVISTANFASAILIEAGLSFLGLGVQPPMPSWGMMVFEGYNSMLSRGGAYLVILPSICIFLVVLSFNLLGNGLRDAYDPKTAIKW